MTGKVFDEKRILSHDGEKWVTFTGAKITEWYPLSSTDGGINDNRIMGSTHGNHNVGCRPEMCG